MLDDTPLVKWSNAWWGMIFLGFCVPLLLVGLLIYCLFSDKAFAVGVLRYRAPEIHPVFGFQATLMMISYLSLALASFAYGYARHHAMLCLYCDKVLAVTLAVGAVCISWCSALFFL